VAPVSRGSMVLGKILGGTSLAVAQGVLFLLIAPFIGVRLSLGGWLEVFPVLVLTAFSMTGLGFIIAWRMQSIQGFHAIMNLFLMPLWLLSGALFPADGAPVWLQFVMKLNPLTYGMAALRYSLYQGAPGLGSLPSYGVSVAITAGFGVLLYAAATLAASKRTAESLP